jgi:hypothetical protein
MKATFLFLFSLFGLALNAQSWLPVGPDEDNATAFSGLSYGSIGAIDIAGDASGAIYAAFPDTYFNSRLTVKKFNGTSWQTLGVPGFTAGSVSFVQVAVSPSGTPYVTFYDGAQDGKAAVLAYNGTAWQPVGNAPSDAAAYNPDLAFDAIGTPYIAYSDGANATKLSVKKFDGTAWQPVGALGFTASLALYPSISISASGTPYVAFSDYSAAGKATLVRFDGASWQPAGTPGFTSSAVSATSLRFSGETPYLAVTNIINNSMKASVYFLNNGAWATLGSPGIAVAQYPSLTIDASGTPYLAYRNEPAKPQLIRWNGTQWQNVGPDLVEQGQDISLVVLQNGTAFIGYSDLNSGKRAMVKKWDGQSWTATATYATSGFPTITKTNLAVNPSTGTLYAAYADYTTLYKGIIRKFNGASWDILPPLNGVVTYLYPQTLSHSIAADGAYLYAAYPRDPDRKISVERFDGASWSYVGPPAFTDQNSQYAKILLYNGTPYLSYQDGTTQKAMVRKFNGTSWDLVGDGPVSAGTAQNIDFAISDAGQPAIVYTDATAGYKATVRYFDGAAWQTAGTPGFSPTATGNPHIAYDHNNVLHVIYANNAQNFKLTVRKFNGTGWDAVGPENITAGATNESIAFSADNTPYITFSDVGADRKSSMMRFDGTGWSYVGGAISGGSSYPELAFYQNTAYVSVSGYYNGFVKSFNTLLGTPGFAASGKIVPYPNPARETLYVSGDAGTVTISDLSGKVVFRGSAANGIDVSGYAAGLYIVRTVNGTAKFAKR